MVEATSMPIIQKAVKVIYDMSEDTRIRELARMREKALHDEASALRQAKDEGREEGKAELRNEMIEKMSREGKSGAQIAKALGISRSTVYRIKRRHEDQ